MQPNQESNPLIKLYRWGRRHRWLAWVYVGVVGGVLILVTAGVFYGIGQMKQATGNEQYSVGGSYEPPKKKPVKEVDYTYEGYKYGVGISSITRSKEGAPPGYEKVNVTLQIHNLQSDRSAPGPHVDYGVAMALASVEDNRISPATYALFDAITAAEGCTAKLVTANLANCNIIRAEDPSAETSISSGGQIGADGTDDSSFDFMIREGTPNSDFTIWVRERFGARGIALTQPE